jgi:hypothetical protein
MSRTRKLPRGPSVFLSYSHADRDHPLLNRLTDDLVGKVDLWVDAQTIQLGQPILSLVEGAIQSSDYFIYVVSRSTSQRSWANSEFHLAYAGQVRKQGVKIIPILIDQVPPPPLIAGITAIDFTTSYSEGLADLLRALAPPTGSLLAQFAVDRAAPSGPIIDVATAVDKKLIEHFAQHPEGLRTIDRRRFEELVAELFVGFGYIVELTARTRDGGRDVIAVRDREVRTRYLIECKRPDPGRVVGIRPVRELYGVKEDDRATKAILATTAYFSRDALLFFERHKWELEPRDFKGLMEWVHEYVRLKSLPG